ncbi:hypothetical protein [Flammeovirga aprica]|uniref:Uncharacterized protein n=1 Tax=Flammeovirga aprica JL-4 TaxID=694437 RepID=A0A7X9RV94_9BACT|nr:hypothetical protein [Flammeovirga aprica]NME69365.1 hypothetical protein [Flammeovirga aprica JL-4]
MKKFILPFILLPIFFACNEENEAIEEPVKEGRVITIRPVIEEQITPMNESNRDPKEGLIYDDYTIIFEDERGVRTFEEFSLRDTLVTVDQVFGSFTIVISHNNSSDLVSENYYLFGEAHGESVDESVTIRMRNEQFAYVLVDGAQDEVTGARIDDFQFLADSEEEYPNFYAYVQADASHKIVINTVRGLAGVELVEAQADKKYTYSVNFSTDGKIIIDPGFGGRPIEFDPIETPSAPVVEIVDGAEDVEVVDPFTGAVTGVSVERPDGTHQVWAYGATGLSRDDNKAIQELDPHFKVTANTDEVSMSIYLKNGVDLLKIGMTYNNEGERYCEIKNEDNEVIFVGLWDQVVEEYPEAKVHTTRPDGVRLNCNFVVRIGWSGNDDPIEFRIDELSYEKSL